MSDKNGVILRWGLDSIQVCVPKDFTDEDVEHFANTAHPTGIESKWQIVREGKARLAGDSERVTCADDPERVHILLVC